MLPAGPPLQAGPLRTVPAHRHMPTHADGASHLSLLLSGRLQEQVGRDEVEAGAGSVVVKPAEVRHCTRFGPEPVRMLRLSWTATTEWTDAPVLERWRWHAAGPWSLALARVWLALRQPDSTSETWLDHWLDLRAQLEPVACATRTPPATLQQVLDQLHADPSVRVSSLAATAGVHPVSLARLFRRHLGRSIADQRRLLRVLRALQALVADDSPLVEAAAAGGYADQAHFTRECHRLLGQPPRRCRLLLQPATTRLAASPLQAHH